MPEDDALYKFKQGEVKSRLFPTQVFGHQRADWNLKVPPKVDTVNLISVDGIDSDNISIEFNWYIS